MSTFTFIHESNGVTNTLQFDAELWDDAVINFKQFLRGAGFFFDDEVLDDVFDTGDKEFNLDHLPASNWPFAEPFDGRAAGQSDSCPCNHSACGVCGCC